MTAPFEYVFPSIRGVQARREYYVSMCPMRLIPKIFLFDEEELVPELRAQRILNKGRIPELARYIVDNRDNYVFSAITASIDGDVKFETTGEASEGQRVGSLHIPMSARFVINDGQHRRAAIEAAIREQPELADESIAVVFFMDKGLERCQQMFADLNRHSVRPSKSIGVLYDFRDEVALLTKQVVQQSSVFRDLVEMERSTLSLRSRKLFTLSSLYTANRELLSHANGTPLAQKEKLAVAYWEEVAKQLPEWQMVRDRLMTSGEVRREFIHSHGIVLQSIARVGNALLRDSSKPEWKRSLKQLKSIDWSRRNARVWEGRAMIGGRVSKAGHNVTLTTNLIKKTVGLTLTPEEKRVEVAHRRGEHANAN